MKRHILISSLILLSVQSLAAAAVRPVPQQYPTIQAAINAAVDGVDWVVVAPGVYTGAGNRYIDFGGKAIIVTSQINPSSPDPAIIAATIIDCEGTKNNPHRAFWFHSGEGPNSKVLGFTIKNGYAIGSKGANGVFGYTGDPTDAAPSGDYDSIDPYDPDGQPRALPGKNATGNGYGGAILCENNSSPSIKY
ncbi:hypothetical protein LCGC14_2823690, partial [marine sediment metagenome]